VLVVLSRFPRSRDRAQAVFRPSLTPFPGAFPFPSFRLSTFLDALAAMISQVNLLSATEKQSRCRVVARRAFGAHHPPGFGF
jgi:hypothetical protein